MEIFASRIPIETKFSEFEKFLPILSEEKQKKISELTRQEDKLRILMGDILIRIIITEKLKISNKEIQFRKGFFGKRQLKGFDYFYFNLSHSGEWVTCAIDNMLIGIDIEKIRTADMNIARQFFPDEEYNILLLKKQNDRNEFFCDLWTLHSSYMKAIGEGLSRPMDSFTIVKNESGEITLKGETSRNWYFRQYDIDQNYKLSVCASNNNFPSNVIFKTIDELRNDFQKNL